MQFKTIIQGRLAFGTEKSFAQALKMYKYRAENYHKSNTLFETEEIFLEKTLEISIPRFVKQIMDKPYRNTVSLLKYCAQFAMDGHINAWLIDEGKILDYTKLEPLSEKTAVKLYQKGKSLVKQEGREEEAIEAFNSAIEKYDKHAQAYERRGKVNYLLKNYHDAKRDYNKSISIDATNPHPFYGRAKVNHKEGDINGAIADYELVIKLSVALQPIYWKARRRKGILLYEEQNFEKAAFDLKLFTNRKFKPENENYNFRKYTYYYYGLVLMGMENYLEAIDAFNTGLEITDGYDKIPRYDFLRNRGLSKSRAGKNGHIKDLKEAISLGDKKAPEVLKSLKK